MVYWVISCSHITTFSLLGCMADTASRNCPASMISSRYRFDRFRYSWNWGWRVIDDDDFLGEPIFVEIVPIRLSRT